MTIKQIYHKYELWEDYNNGMYNSNDILDKNIKAFDCIDLLTNSKLFYETCIKLLSEWPISCDVNLSNTAKNRRAWLGAAACSYHCQAPEYITRIAWSLINKDKQDMANLVAERVILQYEERYKGIHKNVGEQMLF